MTKNMKYSLFLTSTSNSSIDDSDFQRLGSEIVLRRACSAATYISASLIGRSMELSKFPGEELVLEKRAVCALVDGDILEDTSEPKLPA